MNNRNSIAYWLPHVLASGAPIPATVLVVANLPLGNLLDGVPVPGWDRFLAELAAAVPQVGGWPVFLRTGELSAKHQWRHTCYVERVEDLASHVAALVEESTLAGFFGLPTNVWAVRQFLRLQHIFTAYEGMPVAKEFRLFVEGGEVLCRHRYWPQRAVAEGRPQMSDGRPLPSAEWRGLLDRLYRTSSEERQRIQALGQQVSRHLEGAWSVDVCQAEDGAWYVTDCAVAADSYHWPDCPVREARGWPRHEEPEGEVEDERARRYLADGPAGSGEAYPTVP